MGMQPQLQASGSVTMGSSTDEGPAGLLASAAGEAVSCLPGVPGYKALLAAVRRDRTDVLEAVSRWYRALLLECHSGPCAACYVFAHLQGSA